MARKPLTDKQMLFCKEYLKDLNASQAALRAGYSPRTADRTGHENLKKPVIADRISKELAKRSARVEIGADNVLKELAVLGFSNIMNYARIDDDGELRLDFGKMPSEASGAIQEVTQDVLKKLGDDDGGAVVVRTKIRLHPKMPAIDAMMKHLGLFPRGTSAGLEQLIAAITDRVKEMTAGERQARIDALRAKAIGAGGTGRVLDAKSIDIPANQPGQAVEPQGVDRADPADPHRGGDDGAADAGAPAGQTVGRY